MTVPRNAALIAVKQDARKPHKVCRTCIKLQTIYKSMLSILNLTTTWLAPSVPSRSRKIIAQSYGDGEAANQWYRTGKDTKRWKPGDKTGDALDDRRLRWSAWKLDPPQLRVPS